MDMWLILSIHNMSIRTTSGKSSPAKKYGAVFTLGVKAMEETQLCEASLFQEEHHANTIDAMPEEIEVTILGSI